MAGMTVKQLASVLNLPVERLLTQFKEAGLKPSTADAEVQPSEKIRLLEHLRSSHGKAALGEEAVQPQQITLKRKTLGELTMSSPATPGHRAPSKTVSVEVRQKRTYVSRAAVGGEVTEVDKEREDARRKLGESKLRAETEESIRKEREMRRSAEESKAKAEAPPAVEIAVVVEPQVIAAPAPIADASPEPQVATPVVTAPASREIPVRQTSPGYQPSPGYRPREGSAGYAPRDPNAPPFRPRDPNAPFTPRDPNAPGFRPRDPNAPPFRPRDPNAPPFRPRDPNAPFTPRDPNAPGFRPRDPNAPGFRPRDPNAPPFRPRDPNAPPFRPRDPNAPFTPRDPNAAPFRPRDPNAPPFRPRDPNAAPFAPRDPNAGPFKPRDAAPGGAPGPFKPRVDAKPGGFKGAQDDRRAKAQPSKGKTGGAIVRTGQFIDEESSPSFNLGQLHLADGASRRPKRKQKMRQAEPTRNTAHGFSKPTAPVTRDVSVGETIQVGELAQKIAVKTGDVVKALMKMGVMATINQVIDHDTAALVAEELGHKVSRSKDEDIETTIANTSEANDESARTRPPVVTIMGHVDHGKTSLLDYIRRTKVASGEAGGITQHIGAYHVTTKRGVVTFLDTPGHAAFSSMRARGAKLTDIVVLVVAADDGVMPQTIEAIQHAKAAKVPLIIAVNKMDKADANPDRVTQGLLQYEVVPESLGGDVMFVPLSAKTGKGVEELLDSISLQAEVMDLKASSEGRARGVVVEASLDRGRGNVATVLVQNGTLRKGDVILCGTQFGRVRALYDETGRQVNEAGPSIPVVVVGLQGTPNAGDDFMVLADERMARDAALQRETKLRDQRFAKQAGGKPEDIFSQITSSEVKTLNILLKADVQGSSEALKDSLTKLSTDDIKVNVIGSGVGGINESDATLAVASKAMVIGFNVRADASARKVFSDAGVAPNYYSIIYEVIDQVRAALTGLLGTEFKEQILGLAQVRDVFRSSKFGAVAGCMVTEGIVKRKLPIRVLRDNVVVFEGELESLRRFKEIVDDVRNGMECGIAVKQYNDVKVGDQIECFERIEVQRKL